jgi:hypothetical protein
VPTPAAGPHRGGVREGPRQPVGVAAVAEVEVEHQQARHRPGGDAEVRPGEPGPTTPDKVGVLAGVTDSVWHQVAEGCFPGEGQSARPQPHRPLTGHHRGSTGQPRRT